MLFQRLTNFNPSVSSTAEHTEEVWKWAFSLWYMKMKTHHFDEVAQSQDVDRGRSGADKVSPALVEAYQPTQRIRDTNIHRKHSPRYTDVPVFVNTWNKAGSDQRTQAGRGQKKRWKKKIKSRRQRSAYRKLCSSCSQTRCPRVQRALEEI